MRIGISLLCSKKERTGTDNVVYNLIRNLDDIDEKNRYVIFTTDRSRHWFSSLSDRFETINVKPSSHRCIWLWEQLFFHLDPRSKGLDLVYFPQARGVLGYRGKNVLMIHDLYSYLGLHNVSLRQQLIYILWYKTNISRANMIVTVSEYVKSQILEHFSVPSHKVRVVYNGVDKCFDPLPKSVLVKKQYGLPDRYILFVGSTHSNKNIMRLIKAFWLVRQKGHICHHLVIAGEPGDEDSKLRIFVKHNGLQDIVHFCGYFPDKDLSKLYSHAELFVFPTLDEGFGIPPIEAMACGTPVLTSNIPVMREVLGESAIFVNPFSIDAIAEGIAGTLLNSSIRDEMTRKGFERVKKFSWKKTAAEMMKVFEEADHSK